MRPLAISICALAVPAHRISGIVNGTRAITADTALRLGKSTSGRGVNVGATIEQQRYHVCRSANDRAVQRMTASAVDVAESDGC